MAARAAAVVSPVRRAHRIAGRARPCSRHTAAIPSERGVEVLLHVTAQRLERRDVHDLDAVPELSGFRAPSEGIDAREERRQRFAGPRRRSDQRIVSGDDLRPTARLRARRRLERALEPCANCGVK